MCLSLVYHWNQSMVGHARLNGRYHLVILSFCRMLFEYVSHEWVSYDQNYLTICQFGLFHEIRSTLIRIHSTTTGFISNQFKCIQITFLIEIKYQLISISTRKYHTSHNQHTRCVQSLIFFYL